jgi:hypothetical protein
MSDSIGVLNSDNRPYITSKILLSMFFDESLHFADDGDAAMFEALELSELSNGAHGVEYPVVHFSMNTNKSDLITSKFDTPFGTLSVLIDPGSWLELPLFKDAVIIHEISALE